MRPRCGAVRPAYVAFEPCSPRVTVCRACVSGGVGVNALVALPSSLPGSSRPRHHTWRTEGQHREQGRTTSRAELASQSKKRGAGERDGNERRASIAPREALTPSGLAVCQQEIVSPLRRGSRKRSPRRSSSLTQLALRYCLIQNRLVEAIDRAAQLVHPESSILCILTHGLFRALLESGAPRTPGSAAFTSMLRVPSSAGRCSAKPGAESSLQATPSARAEQRPR